jgi:HD-GYP domain-containing protein (c-di-GMP phosphodiesterase class II)
MALDAVEEELLFTTTNHGKRVAYIALRLGESYNLPKEELFDLCSYSIVHDNGIIQSYQKLKDKKSNIVIEDLKDHCKIGEKNISTLPFLTNQKNIILYHHEHYDGSGFFGKKGDEIPLLSQLIFLADMIDREFNLNNITLKIKEDVITFIKNNKNKLFSPQLVEHFLKLASNQSFWFDLDKNVILSVYTKHIPNISIEITYEKMLEISKVLSVIIDSKSKYTAQHTIDLMEKAKKVAKHYNLPDERSFRLQIAANLHDLGKLYTPLEILDKPTSLTDEELFIMKKHAYSTFALLNTIEGFEEVNKIASSHHEKLDGSGYPFGLKDIELEFEERILACLDIYQALTEIRPYRDAMTHNRAMGILYSSAKDNLIDINIVEDIDKIFGKVN